MQTDGIPVRTGTEASPGARFSPKELLEISEEISRSWRRTPPGPGYTDLVLMPIDPRRAHTYWNIEVADLNRAREETGRAFTPMMLSVHRAESDGAPSGGDAVEEREVRLLRNCAYLEGLAPGGRYIAQIGLRKTDGSLALLARSRPVTLPPAEPSLRFETAAVDTAREINGQPVVTDLAVEITGPIRPLPSPSIAPERPSSIPGSGRG